MEINTDINTDINTGINTDINRSANQGTAMRAQRQIGCFASVVNQSVDITK
jgi:hypothetical protein